MVVTSTAIPGGRSKSGRTWKTKQTTRHSSMLRKGILSHLAKTFEEKEAIRQKQRETKELERSMVEEKKQKKIDERLRREEQQKRRMANEYKTAVYQTVRFDSLFSRVW